MNAATTLQPALVLEAAATAGELAPAASPKARKPRLWTPFATLLAAWIAGQLVTFVAVVATMFAAGFILGAQGLGGPMIQARLQAILQQPLSQVLLTLVPFQLGMLLVVLFAARRSKEPWKQRLGLVPQTGRALGGFRLAMLAAFTLSIALTTVLLTAMFAAAPTTMATGPVAAVAIEPSWWTILLAGVITCVLPPLIEEPLFRGYIQRRLLQRWSPAVAIGVSSLLFAVMHMDSLQHVIAVLPLGIVIGLLAYRTNSIKPGMLVHAIHNIGAVGIGPLAALLSRYMSQEQVGMMFLGMIVVMGLVGLSAVISLVRHAKPQLVVEAPPALKPSVESLLERSREFRLPNFGTDSRLAGPAV
jgi:membrane protease YdiL (CAAX protease family)